jgi:pimeloyl-ACP methyl ester carboxylesterase
MRWTAGVCEANGIDVHHVRTGGARPPLVLLHGLMGSGACWTPLARALEDEYDVVMPDERGHGSSSAPPEGYRYADHAADVVGLVRGLGLAPAFLLGHSMGGMTAAVVAHQCPEVVRALVLADPTFLSPERQREVFESDVAEQHRRALGLTKSELLAEARGRHPRRSPEILELFAEARLHTRMSALDVLAPPNPDFRQLVGAIGVPTLLVIGDTGNVVSLETARELQRLNPRVRVAQIPEAGHAVPFDQPGRFEEVVRSFLRAAIPSRSW